MTDYNTNGTRGDAIILVSVSSAPLYEFGSAVFGPMLGPLVDQGFNCTTSIDRDVDQQLARQRAVGPYTEDRRWHPTLDWSMPYALRNKPDFP